LKKEGKMKKLLLATSALTLMAGAASAEIALSGSARMGLVYDSTLNGGSGETYFSSRVRIVFTASGETDSGLSFGASMRADQDGGNADGSENGDSTVFISGAFGKLTMGDVGGAADALVGQVSGVGYGPNDALQEISFLGTTKTAVYYEYSAGALTFGLGAGQVYLGPDCDGSGCDSDTVDEMNVAVKYSTDAYSVALGYETSDVEDRISASASATFGAATVKARVSDSDSPLLDTAWAVSVDYVTGATTLTAFYTDFGLNGVFLGDDTQHIGIGASYDLGGGASVAGGIVQQNNDVADDETFADIGLKFSF
jgi:outer membrane protein OmpU